MPVATLPCSPSGWRCPTLVTRDAPSPRANSTPSGKGLRARRALFPVTAWSMADPCAVRRRSLKTMPTGIPTGSRGKWQARPPSGAPSKQPSSPSLSEWHAAGPAGHGAARRRRAGKGRGRRGLLGTVNRQTRAQDRPEYRPHDANLNQKIQARPPRRPRQPVNAGAEQDVDDGTDRDQGREEDYGDRHPAHDFAQPDSHGNLPGGLSTSPLPGRQAPAARRASTVSTASTSRTAR
jgi:hypothetical protein